jgi:hypothetical protein
MDHLLERIAGNRDRVPCGTGVLQFPSPPFGNGYHDRLLPIPAVDRHPLSAGLREFEFLAEPTKSPFCGCLDVEFVTLQTDPDLRKIPSRTMYLSPSSISEAVASPGFVTT